MVEMHFTIKQLERLEKAVFKEISDLYVEEGSRRLKDNNIIAYELLLKRIQEALE